MTLLTDRNGNAVSHGEMVREEAVGYSADEARRLPGALCSGSMEFIDRSDSIHHVARCVRCGWSVAVAAEERRTRRKEVPEGW